MTRRTPVLVALLVLALALPPVGASAHTASPEPTPTVTTEPSLDQDGPTGVSSRVAEIMAGMSRRQKVGQLFMTRLYGPRATSPTPAAVRANERYLGVADAQELFERFGVGAVVYFDYTGNLQRPEQIARLSNGIQQAALDAGTVPVLISTDQEHGTVARLGPPATRFPGSMALGATRDETLAREAARVTGADLRAVGINQNLAPVADVNNNPANPVIGVRSFGSRPGLVADLTRAQVIGFEADALVASTVKHFPGHGDTSVDSHVGLPVVRHGRQRWLALDAPPFVAAIEADVDVVMTAHVKVPALDPSERPATLSRPILTGVLRDQLGFEGVVMTDSLTMEGVRTTYGDERVPVLALKAGADILADPPHLPSAYRAVLAAVERGEISDRRLDQSVERILSLKERLGLLEDAMVDVTAVGDLLGTPDDEAVARAVGEAATTVLRDHEDWLPFRDRWQVLVTGLKPEGGGALVNELEQAGHEVTTRWAGVGSGRGKIRRTVRTARAHDVTVVITKHLGVYPAQRELVRRLLDSGSRVIVVFAGSPYDVTWFPGAAAQVATYSTVPASMYGLARVLSGESRATGRLPVRVPRPGGGTLYAYGHGLSPTR